MQQLQEFFNYCHNPTTQNNLWWYNNVLTPTTTISGTEYILSQLQAMYEAVFGMQPYSSPTRIYMEDDLNLAGAKLGCSLVQAKFW